MLSSAAFLALAASPVMGSYAGFNYGSTFTTGAAKVQSDFEAEFKTAQGLISAPTVFNSARLYTTIQGGTTNSPIEAIPAAISTKTTLLLGLWASGGDAAFANEIAALSSAISTYGSSLASQVAGISVGSEDLYRISPTGILNGENPGASPDTVISYIKQVRDAIANTPLASVPVGHVDTWTAWANTSNSAVAAASDWVGVDAYPYFQDTMANSIASGQSLFNSAVDQTKAAVGSKPVWITETGWPVSGPTRNQGVASLDNAKTYWDEVGCALFESTNVWWYTLQDAAPDTPSPSFGIVGSTLTTTPLYDLSCNSSSSSSSSSVSASGTVVATTLPASATASGIDSGSPGVSGGVGGTSAAASATITGAASSPTASSSSGASGSGSAGSGSGSGSGSGAGSGTSGSGSNGTYTSTVPSSTVVTTNSASSSLISSAAAFVALLAASLVL